MVLIAHWTPQERKLVNLKTCQQKNSDRSTERKNIGKDRAHVGTRGKV